MFNFDSISDVLSLPINQNATLLVITIGSDQCFSDVAVVHQSRPAFVMDDENGEDTIVINIDPAFTDTLLICGPRKERNKEKSNVRLFFLNQRYSDCDHFDMPYSTQQVQWEDTGSCERIDKFLTDNNNRRLVIIDYTHPLTARGGRHLFQHIKNQNRCLLIIGYYSVFPVIMLSKDLANLPESDSKFCSFMEEIFPEELMGKQVTYNVDKGNKAQDEATLLKEEEKIKTLVDAHNSKRVASNAIYNSLNELRYDNVIRQLDEQLSQAESIIKMASSVTHFSPSRNDNEAAENRKNKTDKNCACVF